MYLCVRIYSFSTITRIIRGSRDTRLPRTLYNMCIRIHFSGISVLKFSQNISLGNIQPFAYYP